MIDLHCHILPGIDDGAADSAVSLEMARLFVADGVTTVACTPHILQGLYPNTGPQITSQVASLQSELDRAGIGLRLIAGADVHMTPDFVAGLAAGRLLTLGGSRYVLVEPPHHVAPPRYEEFFFSLLVAGYVPILTHPERLTWVSGHYAALGRLVASGVWMQLTAGSLTGAFGRSAQSLAERMLKDGLVHILATDAHDAVRRPPILGRGRDMAARWVGDEEANNLVVTRPSGVIESAVVSSLPSALALAGVSLRLVDPDRAAFVRARDDGVRKQGFEHEKSGDRRGLRGFSERLRGLFD